MADCLFCSIVAGDIPADIVLSNDRVVAFRDISPQAPTHVLVIPRAHHANIGELASGDPQATAALLQAAGEVAEAEGIGDAYRLVFNTGEGAGQSVFHVHGHVLGGRDLTWPPG
jgi:histidine triad (HIT) family protein